MDNENPEYKALERIITADKRQRKFAYSLYVVLFASLFFYIAHLAAQSEQAAAVIVAKQAAANNHYAETVARETIRYNTCILLLSLPQRQQPAIQQACFDKADLPGGLSKDDFTPFLLNTIPVSASTGADEAAGPPASDNGGADSKNQSSSNGNTSNQSSQSDNSQPSPPPGFVRSLVQGTLKGIAL